MQFLTRPWGQMHYKAEGKGNTTLVFANSLGTDLRLWDKITPALSSYRLLRFDKRGHGLSDFGGAHSIEDLAADAAALIEAEAQGPVIFIGLSIGGMIGQSLATHHPELLKALVLSNTAPRMGSPQSWLDRIHAVEEKGISSISDAVMERWFAPAFRKSPERALWQNMLERTLPAGYIESCRAIAGADLTALAATLHLPTQLIAGSEDGASPPSLLREAAALIPGARYAEIEGAGHLPPVETPDAFLAILSAFLQGYAQP